MADALTLKRLTIHQLAIPFRLSFKHAAASRKQADVLIVTLESEQGVVGFGECHTREYVTGESLDGATKDLAKLWWPSLKGLVLQSKTPARDSLAPFHAEADRTGRLAAYGAVDLAVFDLWAKAFKVPGRRLFGTEAATVAPVSAPIGLGMPPGLVSKIYKAFGFRDFKAKVGDAKDLERLTAIRLAIGDGSRLRIDANGVWSREEALKNYSGMKGLALSSLEQPLAKASVTELGRLAEEIDVPVTADESLCSTADAQSLLRASPKIQWNIRVGKVGGLSGALALIELAEEKGVKYQLGALVGESSLLTAAQRALLSVAHPQVVESSFPKLLLAGDPFRGGPPPLSPKAVPLGMEPGLGVKLNPMTMRRFVTRSTILD